MEALEDGAVLVPELRAMVVEVDLVDVGHWSSSTTIARSGHSRAAARNTSIATVASAPSRTTARSSSSTKSNASGARPKQIAWPWQRAGSTYTFMVLRFDRHRG